MVSFSLAWSQHNLKRDTSRKDKMNIKFWTFNGLNPGINIRVGTIMFLSWIKNTIETLGRRGIAYFKKYNNFFFEKNLFFYNFLSISDLFPW